MNRERSRVPLVFCGVLLAVNFFLLAIVFVGSFMYQLELAKVYPNYYIDIWSVVLSLLCIIFVLADTIIAFTTYIKNRYTKFGWSISLVTIIVFLFNYFNIVKLSGHNIAYFVWMIVPVIYFLVFTRYAWCKPKENKL